MSSIYEFIQRRADWKKIEKTVDKVSSAWMSQPLSSKTHADRPGHVRFVSQG
jgi:hypothetical protein